MTLVPVLPAYRHREIPRMTPIRTALVGCGKVAGLHAAALSTLPESDFVAVCDSDPARAAAFAAKYGTQS